MILQRIWKYQEPYLWWVCLLFQLASLNLEVAPPGDFTPRKGDIVLSQISLGTEQGLSMLEKTGLRCSRLIMVIKSI